MMVGLGLTAPMAAQMLASAGVAHAQAKPAFTPTRRGGGGELKTLWWQAVSILNCHLAVGVKDNDGSRLFSEPLAAIDPDGNLVPVLAAEIPTLDNGGVAKDGLSVTWKLKRNVQWHDGKPFTADDVVFTWEFAADPATAATTAGNYKDIARIDKIDSHTVKIGFKNPTPYWAISFCGTTGLVIPRHVFEPFKGAKSREAPANMKPVGTGPYRYVDFKPNDVVRAELNPNYHVPNWPFFDRVEVKGGGDATSAARAVLQTGEYDFAWNLQVEDDILKRMEQGGKGRVDFTASGNIEHVNVNQTDPWTEVDGERSSLKTKHPLLSDPAVRQALSLVIDRGSMQEQLYGRAGPGDRQLRQRPQPLPVQEHPLGVQRREGEQGLLDDAGWKRGADGIRAKDGKRLKFLLQTSINPLRQKEQAIIKAGATKAGMEMELKTVVASVFFGSDEANPDNIGHFSADLQMYAWQFDVDPQPSMRVFPSWEVASKENKFSGRNTTRWRNEEFDRLYKAAETEMDPVKRAAHFIRMNDLVVQNMVVIPLVWRNWVSGVGNKLKGTEISGWDSSFWNLRHWYREA